MSIDTKAWAESLYWHAMGSSTKEQKIAALKNALDSAKELGALDERKRLEAGGYAQDYESTAMHDIHRETASKMFGVAYDDVTPEQRSIAKGVTFWQRFAPPQGFSYDRYQAYVKEHYGVDLPVPPKPIDRDELIEWYQDRPTGGVGPRLAGIDLVYARDPQVQEAVRRAKLEEAVRRAKLEATKQEISDSNTILAWLKREGPSTPFTTTFVRQNCQVFGNDYARYQRALERLAKNRLLQVYGATQWKLIEEPTVAKALDRLTPAARRARRIARVKADADDILEWLEKQTVIAPFSARLVWNKMEGRFKSLYDVDTALVQLEKRRRIMRRRDSGPNDEQMWDLLLTPRPKKTRVEASSAALAAGLDERHRERIRTEKTRAKGAKPQNTRTKRAKPSKTPTRGR